MYWKRGAVVMLTLALFLPFSAIYSVSESQTYENLHERNILSFSNDKQIIDNALWKRISLGHHNEIIEIIVQFNSGKTGELEENILLNIF